MESFTATIITVAPSNPIDYLQDFMKSTFANLGFTITHFYPTIFQHVFAHIKFDFHIEHDNGTIEYQERKRIATQMLQQLKHAPIEIPGHPWSMSL
jgi:hypothetical protein